MVPNHATQTDPYLHEPKGVSTATAGTVYVADGAGSGAWTAYGTGTAFNNTTYTGLSFTISSGYLRALNSVTLVPGVTLTLTDATTNYVYVDIATATILSNTTGFIPGQIPIWTVVTASGAVVSRLDHRGSVITASPSSFREVTRLSDASITLSAVEYANRVIKLSGTISVARNTIVPVTLPPTHFHNNMAFATTIIGATGTGVSIASTKKAEVYGDGTNILRLTADI